MCASPARWRRQTVTGEIVTRPGRLEVDQILEQLSRSPYRTEATTVTVLEGEAPPSDSALSPFADNPRAGLYDTATIDVRLRLPDDLLLRGRDMHASFSRIGLGDMNITVGRRACRFARRPPDSRMSSAPLRSCEASTTSRDAASKCCATARSGFRATRPIDPALQVDAQRIISGVTAIVNIRGTARQPQVRLSSQPPLDEADVLSLIVFNQPINQLGGGERLNLAERAGGLAVGYLATPLANSIASALDLDIFEIRATGGESGQPSIAVGQQFGSRLFVSFRQEFGSDDFAQLSLEYRINELLRLVSTVTQGNQRSHRTQRIDSTGLDLIYTLSY